jgi:probable H4MPT-linked C1 transfer pathway protein
VAAICGMASELAGPAEARFYAGARGFLGLADAIDAWPRVASANWHASAAWVATSCTDALLIEIGSTTTDIIPIAGGRPAPLGHTDAERLESGELVYTGVMRTSLMSLGETAPFAGRMQRLMAENFATTADLYRLSGELAPEDDSYPASDGRTKSPQDCRARIARMFGRDLAEADAGGLDLAACIFRERQMLRIVEAVGQVLSGGRLPDGAPFVGAGAGRFLTPGLASRFGRKSQDFATMAPCSEEARRKAGVCAPAVAVALLAATAG